MTPQEAKEQAAMEAGYISFRLAVITSATDALIDITNRALELYGNSQWNAAIDAAAESATIELRFYMVDGEFEPDDVGQEIMVNEPNEYIGVNKQSILKLKKP